MVRQLPKTESMNISDVESALSHVVRQVHDAQVRILVEESGIPVAALISADDLARFAELEREHDARFAVIDRARAAFHDVPAEEIEAETDRIIAGLRTGN
jgi:prevent-host-death family protein